MLLIRINLIFCLLFPCLGIAGSFPLKQVEALRNCKDCNLIVISLTSLRKKNMSFYGYERNTTPNITEFFKDAYVFNNAFAPAALTYTDSISFFFSLSPLVHQAYVRNRKKYTSDVLKKYSSIADILGKSGYRTAAFVSDEDYEYDWGIGRTFQTYFDRSHYADNGILFRPFSYSVGTSQLVPIASSWLEENKNKKFFLFLQVYDLHCPFSPKGEFQKLYLSAHSLSIPFDKECFMAKDQMKPIKKDSRTKFLLKSFFAYLEKHEKSYYFEKQDLDYLISRYDAELNQADSHLKAFFDKISALQLEKNTVIVFMSEHGDYHGENGFFFKTSATAPGNLHNNNLGIPLMIKIPGKKTKTTQGQIVQIIDIAPSLLDILGLKAGPLMQGKSFKSVLNTEKEINDYGFAFSVRYGFVKQEKTGNYYYVLDSIQNKEWKLDHSLQYTFPERKFKEELYYLFNLKKDPLEEKNIAGQNPDVMKKLTRVLEEKRMFYRRGI